MRRKSTFLQRMIDGKTRLREEAQATGNPNLEAQLDQVSTPLAVKKEDSSNSKGSDFKDLARSKTAIISKLTKKRVPSLSEDVEGENAGTYRNANDETPMVGAPQSIMTELPRIDLGFNKKGTVVPMEIIDTDGNTSLPKKSADGKTAETI